MAIAFQRDICTDVGTRLPIDVGQWRVMLDGRCVGYVCDAPGSPLNLSERLSGYVQEQLRLAVVEQLGSTPKLVSEPPDMRRFRRHKARRPGSEEE